MTKKDFIFIAATLHASKPEYRLTEDRKVWERTAIEFANRLAYVNPRFDRERFLSACNDGK